MTSYGEAGTPYVIPLGNPLAGHAVTIMANAGTPLARHVVTTVTPLWGVSPGTPLRGTALLYLDFEIA